MKRTWLLIWLLSAACMLQAATENMQFAFYGRLVTVRVNQELRSFSFPAGEFSYVTVARALNRMHELEAAASMADLKKQAKEFSLDNIGLFQLIKVFTVRCFPNQTMEFRKSLAWYGLRDAGIDAVLAGNEQYLNLFVRMENSPDGGFSLNHNGQKYTSATADKITFSKLEVWRLQLLQDSAREALQLDMYNMPVLGGRIVEKQRVFEVGDKTYTLNTRYNQDVVEYLNDLPSFRIGSYLYTLQPTEEAQVSMDDSLTVWLMGKTYDEKLAFLLALVQNAFPYKADLDYRRREKRNFVEQSLADDFLDCEDKAALFCYLANKYLSAETVLLYSRSQTHVACAIELPEKAPGFTFKYMNKPYLICEPAFSGLKPGETELTPDEIRLLEIFN